MKCLETFGMHFPFDFSWLMISPVSQQITSPWPLSGILLLEETPQRAMAQERI